MRTISLLVTQLVLNVSANSSQTKPANPNNIGKHVFCISCHSFNDFFAALLANLRS